MRIFKIYIRMLSQGIKTSSVPLLTPTMTAKTKKNVGWGNWLAGGRKKQFIKAIEAGNLAEVKRLIGEGVEVNPLSSKENYNPLRTAIYKGNLDIVSALIDAGADINYVKNDHSENSYLMIACDMGYVDMVKLFIEKGADIDYESKVSGRTAFTALPYKKTENAIEIADILIDAGSDINRSGGFTPLTAAIFNIDLFRHLIERGADVNGKTIKGLTAMSEACEFRTPDIVNELVSHGVPAGCDIQEITGPRKISNQQKKFWANVNKYGKPSNEQLAMENNQGGGYFNRKTRKGKKMNRKTRRRKTRRV